MHQSARYAVTCHCGAVAQHVSAAAAATTTKGNDAAIAAGMDICHCRTCRHVTGLLCMSYMRIERPDHQHHHALYDALKAYETSPTSTRYWCAVCGCHVFRRDSRGVAGDDADATWAVATGTIAERATDRDGEGGTGEPPQYARHIHVADTRDGGLSPWLPEIAGLKMASSWHSSSSSIRSGDLSTDTLLLSDTQTHKSDHQSPGPLTKDEDDDVLPASCHCGTVRFHITRPDETSRAPTSNFPDLMIPYHTSPSARIQNPDDEKWWLRPPPPALDQTENEHGIDTDGTPARYLAGTCACRSCRLISGFEIQAWAFVPRSNIIFHVPSSSATTTTTTTTTTTGKTDRVPLDFEALPPGILQSYESSPGVMREFCGGCGATVFWHDKWRPELMDVSVGLLDAREGSRAESWLDWWRDRVSFSEDAANGRMGVVGERASGLVRSLENGLKV